MPIVPIIRVDCLDCGERFPCLEGSAAAKDELCLTCWQARMIQKSIEANRKRGIDGQAENC